jgi:hypothetical protein
MFAQKISTLYSLEYTVHLESSSVLLKDLDYMIPKEISQTSIQIPNIYF